jgi:rubrerythrin
VQVVSLKGSRTEANLRAAFALEASANHRYLWFAEQADVDGRPEVAEIFRHLASGETGHAFGHLEILADIGDPLTGSPLGDTDSQVAAALAAERRDATEVYPSYARVAEEEGFAEIATWLANVAKSEAGHAERLERYLADVNAAEQAPSDGPGR